ncbi:MAG: zinc ABC transporter ATP-binding protein AztA [Alphaproteobacteria bacterium]
MPQATPELIAHEGRILQDDAADTALFVRGLTVSYGRQPAIFSVDATIPVCSITAIVGPNGAGKSTFLKGVLDIVRPLSGEARIFGAKLDEVRHRIAYVPQRASVDWDFPARVSDVVAMGQFGRLGLFRPMRRRDRDAVTACLERVGMAAFAHRQIGQLSGGQQQRVFLARALAQEADLLMLDEPFAGVDAATERAIVQVLHELRDEGRTIVCVHHDLATVADYFDRVLLINKRRIGEGEVDTVFNAETLQAAYGGRLATSQIEMLQRTGG